MADESTILEAFRKETVPQRPEVIDAKRQIIAALQHGKTLKLDFLTDLLGTSMGLSPPDPSAHVPLDRSAGYIEFVQTARPLIDWHRCRVASLEALAELHAEGLVLSAAPPPHPSYSHSIRVPWITVTQGGSNAGSVPVDLDAAQPAATAFRIPLRLRGDLIWGLSVDLVGEQVDPRLWGPRTARCLGEAVLAYRRGVYLGAASLLGAASEGVWYSAAAKLAERDKELNCQYATHQTAALQGHVAELARQAVKPRYRVDDVIVHAALLREIRNYGVHPRPEAGDIERYFTEEECGLLFLTTADYLKRLSSVLVELLTARGQA